MHEQEHWEEKGKKDDGTRLEEFEARKEKSRETTIAKYQVICIHECFEAKKGTYFV